MSLAETAQEPGSSRPKRAEAGSRTKRSGHSRGGLRVPWVFALPGAAALVLFHFVAIGLGAYYAFTNWNLLTHATWVGFRNFRAIASDQTAKAALWHTLILAGSFVVLVNILGLALALGLNRAVKTRHLLRVVFFVPVALSPLAMAFVWQWIFTYQGALNRILADVGLGSLRRAWLGDPSTALWTILVVMVWQFTGLAMVLYLTGLQSISDEVYEAALVDGASSWARFRCIVLPLLAPAITVSATITLVIGLRVFDQVMALTGGGPVDATETLGTQIFKQAFASSRYGYGAALALILTLLIAVLALTQLALLRRNEGRL